MGHCTISNITQEIYNKYIKDTCFKPWEVFISWVSHTGLYNIKSLNYVLNSSTVNMKDVLFKTVMLHTKKHKDGGITTVLEPLKNYNSVNISGDDDIYDVYGINIFAGISVKGDYLEEKHVSSILGATDYRSLYDTLHNLAPNKDKPITDRYIKFNYTFNKDEFSSIVGYEEVFEFYKADSFVAEFIIKFEENVGIYYDTDMAGVYTFDDLKTLHIFESMNAQWYLDDNNYTDDYINTLWNNSIPELLKDDLRTEPMFYPEEADLDEGIDWIAKTLVSHLKQFTKKVFKKAVTNTEVKALAFGDEDNTNDGLHNPSLNIDYYTVLHGFGDFITKAGGCFPVLSKTGLTTYSFICTSTVLENSELFYKLLTNLLSSFVNLLYNKWLISANDDSYYTEDGAVDSVLILQDFDSIDDLQSLDDDRVLLQCVKISMSYSTLDENGNPYTSSDFYNTILEEIPDVQDMIDDSNSSVLESISDWDSILSVATNSDIEEDSGKSFIDLIINTVSESIPVMERYAYGASKENPVFQISLAHALNVIKQAITSGNDFTVHPSSYFDLDTYMSNIKIKFYITPSTIELPKTSQLFVENEDVFIMGNNVEDIIFNKHKELNNKIFSKLYLKEYSKASINKTNQDYDKFTFITKRPVDNIAKYPYYYYFEARPYSSNRSEFDSVSFDYIYFYSDLHTGFNKITKAQLYDKLYCILVEDLVTLCRRWTNAGYKNREDACKFGVSDMVSGYKNCNKISCMASYDKIIDKWNRYETVPGLTFMYQYFLERKSIIILNLPESIDDIEYTIDESSFYHTKYYHVPAYIIYLEHNLDDKLNYSGSASITKDGATIDNEKQLANMLNPAYLASKSKVVSDKYINDKVCTTIPINFNREYVEKYVTHEFEDSTGRILTDTAIFKVAASKGYFAKSGEGMITKMVEDGDVPKKVSDIDNVSINFTVEYTNVVFDDSDDLEKMFRCHNDDD